MKKVSKLLGLICITTILFSTLAGCGQKDSSTGSTDPNKDTDTKKEVRLRFSWWGGDARHKATLDVIDMYTKKNPNVKIDAEYGGFDGYYQKLVTQLSSGTAPDIIQITPEWLVPLNIEGQAFIDLKPKSNLIDISGFSKDYLDKNCTINGKLLGLPTGANGAITLINKTFFKEHNIPLDTEWNWDNILEIGKRVHQENKDHYLITDGAPFIVRAYVMQKTGDPGWVTNDYKMGFNKEVLTEAYNYLKTLYDNGVVQPVQETSLYKKPLENPKWVNSQGGMALTWASTISTYATEKVQLGVVKFPIAKDAKDTGVLLGPPQYLGISNNTKNADEAVKFLNFFFNDKDAIETLADVRGTQPTTKGREIVKATGKQDSLSLEGVSIAEATGSKFFNLKILTVELTTPYNDINDKVAFGKTTPAAAADELIKAYTAALQEMKNKESK